MPVRIIIAVRVSKDIAVGNINGTSRLYFGGALLRALFFRSCLFLENVIFEEKQVLLYL